MKGYKKIIPIVLIAFMAISIYTMISEAVAKQKDLNARIERANKCAEQQLYDKSATLYDEIISLDNDIKYYTTVIDMYIDAKDYRASEDWCIRAKNEFPKSALIYERLIRTYFLDEEYADAYTVLDECDARKCSNKNIEAYREKMQFLYDTRGKTYDDISVFSSGYIGFKKKDLWGLATVGGSNSISAKYEKIGYFANEYIPVKYKNVWYLMTADGEFAYNISKSVNGNVTEVGLYSNNVIPVCVDGKYRYYNLEFKSVYDEYDYAGSFSGGIAAVKKGNSWSLINGEGKAVSKEIYEDIIIDDRGVCCQKERVFVKKGGMYLMVDNNGKKIGNLMFDSAKLFATDDYVAVNIDGLWGFANSSGEIIIEPIYEDADSFSRGLAPVCMGGKWGYIDISKNFIIEKEFEKCTTFTSKGTAFVCKEGDWDIIKLYKYNH